MFHHDLIQETSCPYHDGIYLAQESKVFRKQPMFPKVLTHPCCTCWPQSRWCLVDGSRYSPNIGVVMKHPTICSIHDTCRFVPRLADVLDKREEGSGEFREIGHFRWPIVHFQIDIGSIFRIPIGKHLIVPYSLQGRRLVAWLGRTNQQITTKLEVCLHQMFVVVSLELFHSLVGCQMFILVGSQVKLHSVKVFLVMCHMFAFHGSIVFCQCLTKNVL